MTRDMVRPQGAIFAAAWRNLLISAAGSVLNYLSFVVVAYLFGATAQTDIFLFAMAFVLVLSALITTLFGAIFLPLYIRLMHGPDQGEAGHRFADAFLWRVVCITLAIAAFMLCAPATLFGWVSRFDPAALAQNQAVLACFSAVFFLTVLNEFFRVVLQAREGFVAAASSLVLQATLNLVLIAVFAATWGVLGLALAAVLSRVFQSFYLAWRLRGVGVRLRMRRQADAHLGEFVRLAGPYWLASIVTTLSVFFYDYVASGLPAGQLTAVALAQKIYQLPISMLALPAIEVFNTRISTYYARKEGDGILRIYQQAVTLALLTMLPIGLIISLNAQALSGLLLARGAYTESSLAITATSMSMFALTIPCVVLFSINGRMSLVFQKTKMPGLFGSLGHLLAMGVVWWMVHALGYLGVSVAKLSMELIYFLPFGFLVVYCYQPMSWRPFLGGLVRILLAGAIAYVAAAAAIHEMQAQAWPAVMVLLGSTVLLVGVFAGACRLFRVAMYGIFDRWHRGSIESR